MGEQGFVRNPPKPRKTRDVVALRNSLAAWLRGKLKGADQLAVGDLHIPSGNGISSEIILFDAKWQSCEGNHLEKFAIRVATTENPFFPGADFQAEFRMGSVLSATKVVPVPRTYWFETDTTILGAPFYVMEQLQGRAAPDNPPYNIGGWLTEVGPEKRAAIWWEGIGAMARLHQLDWEAAGLGFMRKAADPQAELQWELDYYTSFFDWACEGRRLDVFDRANQWLRANLPQVGRLHFCWGDARMGNILFHHEKCNGVLDWEMASLGDPEKDLAYWLFFDRYNREGLGAPVRQGWPSHAETIAVYERILGRPLQHLRFYEIFAMYRMAVCLTRLIFLSKKNLNLVDADSLLQNHYFVTSLDRALDKP